MAGPFSFLRRKAAPALQGWDLTGLLTAADPKAEPTQRHLWLVRLMDWLRHAPTSAQAYAADTPLPVLRLRQFLKVLDQHPEHRERVVALLAAVWTELDATALWADFGFTPRAAFMDELLDRLRVRLLPASPDTTDLAELFFLLFRAGDAEWLHALDEATLADLARLLREAVALAPVRKADAALGWRASLYDAITVLTSQIRAAGLSSDLRRRIDPKLLVDRPFKQLARASEQLLEAIEGAGPEPAEAQRAAVMREAQYLRALLDACRRAADSVHEHLEEHGVSVDIVFRVDQLHKRAQRVEALLDVVLSEAPAAELARVVADLVDHAQRRRSIRALFTQHYSMLARKVAERSAETGEHYITRSREEYRLMLERATGGGAVLAATTFAKFAILALGLSAFWAGFGAGLNYALSFVFIHLMHWTVATKQPAMTAPAMVDKLQDLSHDEAVEGFVDEVAHLMRSQVAGILGNLLAVAPLVILVQWATKAVGHPLVGAHDSGHVLHALTFLGPTLFYAAFTGVLLFLSSQIAGWAENAFVLHRLESALRHHPKLVARFGAARADAWAGWWRRNVSGLAANISLGLMLGLVPAVAGFFALPLDVRHVTLSTGQIAAALGYYGSPVLAEPAFWWCVAAIPFTGLLNVGVSFYCAFRLALRARGVRVSDRKRVYAAIRRRIRTQPMSFFRPPR